MERNAFSVITSISELSFIFPFTQKVERAFSVKSSQFCFSNVIRVVALDHCHPVHEHLKHLSCKQSNHEVCVHVFLKIKKKVQNKGDNLFKKH